MYNYRLLYSIFSQLYFRKCTTLVKEIQQTVRRCAFRLRVHSNVEEAEVVQEASVNNSSHSCSCNNLLKTETFCPNPLSGRSCFLFAYLIYFNLIVGRIFVPLSVPHLRVLSF